MPFYKFDNKKIYYEITGKGPVIILHHGFSMWGKDWVKSGWIKNLSNNFTCLIFDAIGHGNSSKPHSIDSYTVESRTNLVLELSENFGSLFILDIFKRLQSFSNNLSLPAAIII